MDFSMAAIGKCQCFTLVMGANVKTKYVSW